jgi:hypothetical protein
MGVASLNGMTVPVGDSITSPSASSTGLLMPKLQYRFRVLLISFGATKSTDVKKEVTKHVIDVTRPNISFDQITVDAYNSRIYLAGKHNWEPITINFRDDVENNVQQLIGEQLTKQLDFFEQSSAASGGDYKFRLKVQALNGGNNGVFNKDGETATSILDEFDLIGCYIESVNYNSFNYAESQPVTISMTVRYDNVIVADAISDSNLTTRVGRTIGSAISGISADTDS